MTQRGGRTQFDLRQYGWTPPTFAKAGQFFDSDLPKVLDEIGEVLAA